MVSEIKDNSPYLIQILLDHASPEAFYGWIDKGVAPHISKYILGEKNEDGTYKKAAISRNIVTGFPSTSANTHVSIVTGSYARKNNLLHTNYWDLTGKKAKFVDVEKMSLSSLKNMNKKHINKEVNTIFEYVKNSASFHAIYRGASYKLFTLKKIVFKLLPLVLKLRDKDILSQEDPLSTPQFWRMLFKDNISKFLTHVKKKGEFPKITFIVFLLSDARAHVYGFESEEYKQAIETLDFFIKSMMEGIKDKKENRIPGLIDMGLEDDIIWNICTDHAGREIKRENYVLTNDIAEKETDLVILSGKREDQEHVLKEIKHDLRKIDAFTIVAGHFLNLWVSGRKGEKPTDFRHFYPEQHYRSYQLKYRNLNTNEDDKKELDLIEYFLNKEHTEFILIPEEENHINDDLKISAEERIKMEIPRTYLIRIISSDGVALIKRQMKNGEVYYAYSLVNGKDPLDYGDITPEYDQFYTPEEWLSHTIKHELPDVFHRIFGFFDCIYAPNLVIVSQKDFYNLSVYKLVEKKKKLLKDFQSHDGLYTDESIVPLTLSGPGIKKGYEIPLGRNIDVLPTVLEALDLEYDKKKIDGIPLRDALE